MPPRKSRDKEVQPAQAEHADDSSRHSEGENDPITFLSVSPLAERSYGNPVFKENEADRGGDFAESSNVFSEGTRVVRETGEESRRKLQAVSEQVVEQVRQLRPEIPLPVVEMPRQIQEAPIPALRGQGNQPHPNIQQQNFFMGEGQRQHEPMEAVVPVADHGHQPQHRYLPPGRRENVCPHHQPHSRDFFQPQVPPTQPVQRDKAKETMGVDADPFPAVSIGVNVADLKSVARNRSLSYAQRNLAAEDLRWVLKAQRSRHSRSVRSNQQRLGGQGRIIVTRNFSPEGARRYSTGTRSPKMVKSPLRSLSRRWEKVSHPKFLAQNPRTLRRKLQCKRAEERKKQSKQVEAEGSSSRRPRQPTKRNIVWVRKEKNETVTQTLLKEDDQSPASPKVASVIVSQDGVLKATFETQEQSENHGAESKEDGTIHFGKFSVNLSCLVLTLPLVFQAKKEEEPIVCEFPKQTEEEAIVVPAQDDEEEDMDDKIVFEKPEEKMARHIRPLYINAHIDGTPISRVLVDNGAAVNVLPTCMLYKISKSLDNLVHTEVTISDFTRGVNHSRGVLPVELTMGNRTLMSAFFVVDIVATYNALLGCDGIHSTNTHLVEARYYEEDIGTIRFFGMDKHEKPIGITACSRPSLSKRVVEEVDKSKIVHEGEEADQGDEITLEELDLAPAKLDDLKTEVQDPLEEINLGYESEQKVTFFSDSLEPQTQDQIVRLLHEFKDCFARDYSEMPATPKDEYPMPIADLLVDGVACHKILSFMDGHSGYNQIVIADVDVPKTAFRCPGAVGTFEWVVMPFGLKNAEATYQRAMNAIFHDMIGTFMEIYIDDVVVKSHGEADHLVQLRKAFERMRQHGLKMNPLKCAFGVSAGNFLGYLVHERGLEVDKNKARAVIEAKPPQNKKELQRFLGQVNFLRRFISNLARKTRVFSPLLKLKFEADFKWEEHHQFAFDMIKCTETMSGAGVVIISPSGLKTQMSFQLDFDCTNNQAEYETLIIGLEMLVEFKVFMVEVIGDSQLALKQLSGLRIPEGVMQKVVIVEKHSLPSIHQRGIPVSTCSIDVTQIDWHFPNIQYLKDQSTKVSRKTKMQALNYVLIEDVLYMRGHDEPLLRCLGPDQSFQMLSNVHDGICGAHQAGIKMCWLIRRHGFFWPSVLKNCIAYAKGCKSCQIHGPLQRVPAFELNSIVKPWPFRGWAIDLIDQGTVFVSHQVEAFAKEMGFRLLNSTPHYAQANGQAKASNKVVINLLEKMVDDNPRRWHELLSETLWAYRTPQRSSTKMTLFALTYGHDVVLPMELTAKSLRIAIQHNLQSGEYDEAMILELEDFEDTRLATLDRLQAQKLKIAKSYNKRVKGKNLAVGDWI
ncbi:hypothetical protein SLEP1_g50088 [Rubroshorea leprosula]|uniref:Integrase catalytic domain-containing protein n=1 Tax=Rubroshorea leprosula TaxID=152421 RepID=A0AAV5LYU8_9ROSI|nr:hypothetical protein SLEP1_g50088 [Rubroshorea leprosula]